VEDIEDIIIRSFRESSRVKEVFANENLSRLVKVVDVITNSLNGGHKILSGMGGAPPTHSTLRRNS